jgi:uncharacterized membrane protein
MKRTLLFTLLLLLAGAASAHAQYTLTSIEYPGGTGTDLRGINSRGDIVGAFQVAPPRHALLIRMGQFLPLGPNTALATNPSRAHKVNDHGDVAGFLSGDDGFQHGFLYTAGGALTQLDYPGAADTFAYGINNSNTVVGVYDTDPNSDDAHGFIWSNGVFTPFDVPGAIVTIILAVNDRGDLGGVWANDTEVHMFLVRNGHLSSFDVPVAGVTVDEIRGMNDLGQLVGYYEDSNGIDHGYVWTRKSFTTIDYPGATLTFVEGINSAGQIVGRWFDADFNVHGFVGSPEHKGKRLAEFDR